MGTEVTVGVLDTGEGPVPLPVIEIESPNRFYNFETRINLGETNFWTPARIPGDYAERAAEVAVTAHRVLGLTGLSRSDIIVDASGTPWFLEASINPSLTESAPYPLALEAAGHDIGWVYSTLSEQAIARAAG
jgi:D-alanine-D-alanine ligase